MKWIGEHRIQQNTRFGTYTKVYLPGTGGLLDAGSDTDKFLVSGTQGLLGYRTGAEVLSDIGGLPTSTNILAFDGSTANGICTFKDANEISVESTLTYDSGTLNIGADDNAMAVITRLAHSDDAGGILQVTAGSATNGQTNKAGGGLRLAGGSSTGSGAGGSVTLFTSPAGDSGTGINGYSNSWVFGADGSFTTEGGITTGTTSFANASGVIQVATQGTIDHDSLANFASNEHYTQANIVATGTIASGTWEGTDIGVAHGGTGLSTVTANTFLTGNGTSDLIVEANLTYDGTNLQLASDAVSAPDLILLSTSNHVTGSNLIFNKLRADNTPADGDAIGTIVFQGEDDGGGTQVYGTMAVSSNETGAGEEDGRLSINVAAHDGGLASGLILEGGNVDDEVDVTIAKGAASVTTVAGTFICGSRTFAVSSATDGNGNGDVVYFGGTTSMTIGTIYHYKSDGTWEVANANAVATSDGLLGVALGAASDTNGMLLRGMVTLDHDPGAVGDVLYLSNTNGDASSTAPSDNNDIVRVIGYCLHASNGAIWFNPDSTFVEVTA